MAFSDFSFSSRNRVGNNRIIDDSELPIISNYTDQYGRLVNSSSENPTARKNIENSIPLNAPVPNSSITPVENSRASVADITTRKATGLEKDKKYKEYYFPSELLNPEILGYYTPPNIIQFQIQDFKGGLLQNELLKLRTSPDNTNISNNDRDRLVNEANPTTDVFDLSALSASIAGSTLRAAQNEISNLSGGFISPAQNNPKDEVVSNIIGKIVDTEPLRPDITLGSIFLYAPNNLLTEYSMIYDDVDLSTTKKMLDMFNSFGGRSDALKQLGINFANSLLNSSGLVGAFAAPGQSPDFRLDALLASKTRKVPVANFEYLFQRVDRRRFEYTFKFYPKTIQEIEQTYHIINCFKYFSHPEKAEETNYLKSPSVFQISYYTWNQHSKEWCENIFLNRIKPCVLSSMEVDYSDAGKFSTLALQREHSSSSPVVLKSPIGVSLTLQFTETLLLNRNDLTNPNAYDRITDAIFDPNGVHH